MRNLAKAQHIFLIFYPPAKAGGNRIFIATGFSLWINEIIYKRALAQ